MSGLNGQDLDLDAGVIAQFHQKIHGGELMQGEISGFAGRHFLDLELEKLSRGSIRHGDGIHDENARGATRREQEVEEDVADAGSDVESADGGRERVIPLEILDHQGTEAVISEENVAAAEDENPFAEKLFDHTSPSRESFPNCANCALATYAQCVNTKRQAGGKSAKRDSHRAKYSVQ
jgi:hypothetical protein